MISRNSFWASSLENHKRKIGVWIIAVLAQLLVYVGGVTVYLSRIRYWNQDGRWTLEQFRQQMVQAAQDALGFQPFLWLVVTALAVLIGGQGFAYLNNRRKVDLYHSVPVSRKRRFLVIYLNGIMIYVGATLVGLLAGIAIAAAQRAVSGAVLAVVGIAFAWNLMFFLVVYHLMILAVMLTGHDLMALGMFAVLALYEPAFYSCISSFRYYFFERTSSYFVPFTTRFSAFEDYTDHVYQIKYLGTPQEMGETVLPYLGKWLALALLLLAAAYLCYQKRSSEAAGKAIAFRKLKPVLKLAVVLEVSMIVGGIVQDSVYDGNNMLILAAMFLSAVICCGVMEVLYEFDLKCMLCHWVSSGIAVLCVLAVFSVFQFDLTGYDSYVPEAEQVESIVFEPNADYQSYVEEDSQHIEYIGSDEYLMEHMYLTAVQEVLTLAAKDQQISYEDMEDPRNVQVVYRLKSGRNVERCFYVDFADPDNEEFLNRIVGSAEYQEGRYQVMTDQTPYEQAQKITYTTGSAAGILPREDVGRLLEALVTDMAQTDYSLFRHHLPCGLLQFEFEDYMSAEYPIYDTYTHVLDYLSEYNVCYPLLPEAEDVASITVTNYHNEVYEDSLETGDEMYYSDGEAEMMLWANQTYESVMVQANFYEKEQIAEILKHIYPSGLPANWCNQDEFDSNYSVDMVFEQDSDYPYDRTNYYYFNYNIFSGQAPDFVIEATALE